MKKSTLISRCVLTLTGCALLAFTGGCQTNPPPQPGSPVPHHDVDPKDTMTTSPAPHH